jgi:hypothetical protein
MAAFGLKNVQSSQSTIDARRSPASYSSNLIYPKDPGQHHITLSFYKYQRFTNNNEKRSSTATIILPIPTNLQEQFDAQFSQMEMGLIGNAKKTLEAMSNPNTDMKGLFNTAKAEATEAGKQLAQAYSAANIKEIAGALFGIASTPQSIVAQVRGQIVNPHLVSSFAGTPLRGHAFSWALAPRSLAESETIENIIRTIQQKMHPSRTGVFLQYPDEVDIQVVGTSKNIFQFKTSVVTNFTINRSPGNAPAFFAEVGYPTSYEINLSFMETEAWVREDFSTSLDYTPSATATTANQTQVKP